MSAAISLSHVSKSFGAKKALDDVSLTIPKGKIFGFLGPNGAGKTTTIRCLMDYMRADEGSISILGKDAKIESAILKQDIGFLSSDIQLHPNWSAHTHIEFLSSIKGRGRADELVKLFNLDLKTKVRNLSSGNKQKLAIILAFLGDPRVLIMDEPTRGLDPLLQNQLYDLLRGFAHEGGTVFLSSHNLAEVQQLCDNVAVIRAGKIVADEAMRDIRRMKIHTITAVATKAFDEKGFAKKDIEIVSCSAKTIVLKVRGRIDPVIKLLSKYELTDLDVSHASLEDVFMEFY